MEDIAERFLVADELPNRFLSRSSGEDYKLVVIGSVDIGEVWNETGLD